VAGQEHERLSEETLEEKVRMATQYLAAMDILDPGISHNRGTHPGISHNRGTHPGISHNRGTHLASAITEVFLL
jgi:hypothetical protein